MDANLVPWENRAGSPSGCWNGFANGRKSPTRGVLPPNLAAVSPGRALMNYAPLQGERTRWLGKRAAGPSEVLGTSVADDSESRMTGRSAA
jgi:hypothetical protein